MPTASAGTSASSSSLKWSSQLLQGVIAAVPYV